LGWFGRNREAYRTKNERPPQPKAGGGGVDAERNAEGRGSALLPRRSRYLIGRKEQRTNVAYKPGRCQRDRT